MTRVSRFAGQATSLAVMWKRRRRRQPFHTEDSAASPQPYDAVLCLSQAAEIRGCLRFL
jgi:hypothetical protein